MTRNSPLELVVCMLAGHHYEIIDIQSQSAVRLSSFMTWTLDDLPCERPMHSKSFGWASSFRAYPPHEVGMEPFSAADRENLTRT